MISVKDGITGKGGLHLKSKLPWTAFWAGRGRKIYLSYVIWAKSSVKTSPLGDMSMLVLEPRTIERRVLFSQEEHKGS